MADRIEALKELAQLATPGPWLLRTNRDDSRDMLVYGRDGFYRIAEVFDANGLPENRTNATFIAACDPSTILKLVAVVEKARLAQSSLTVAVESDLGEAWLNPQTARDQWLRDAREALASLGCALAALDDREPA